MGYRFQKFAGIYPIFVRQFLAQNPDYEQLLYRELYDRFIETRYSLSNFYARYMEALGNKAQDLFATLEPLQKAWAREHGVKYGEDTWLRDIVLAQVKAFQPDVIYLQNLNLFDRSFRKQMREACSKRVVIVGWRSAPTQDFTIFRDLDLVLTAGPRFVRKLREGGANAGLQPLAFEHTLLDELKLPGERDLDFTFVGSLGRRNGVFSQRYAMIESIIPSTPLQVWSRVRTHPRMSLKSRGLAKTIYHTNRILAAIGISSRQRARLPLVRRGISWSSEPTLPSVKQRYPARRHEPAFGLGYYEILARSKITFNNHIDAAGKYAGNMRLFQATGMGACLVTDWKVNLPDLFEPGVEVVTYRSAEECIEKVLYLLDHEDERRAIANAGQQRTLRDHTFRQRVEQLDDIINQLI